MKFDEKTVSKQQQKIAQKFIDSVLRGSKLEHPPSYVIKGLGSDEEIAKLEFQKFEKNEKEIKKIDKRIKSLQNYLNNFVKVVFEFDKSIKKLICMSDILKTSKGYLIPRYTYSGVLDFPVASPFLFGRVSKSFGKGDYYFAPLQNINSKISDDLEKLEEKAPDLFPYKIIEFNPFIDLLGSCKFIIEVRDQLQNMPKIIKKNLETTQLVDTLNKQKELITNLKKIAHFGTTQWMNVRLVSKVDVSTVFINYKNVTYFHIDHFVRTPKIEFSAINALLQTLERLNS